MPEVMRHNEDVDLEREGIKGRRGLSKRLRLIDHIALKRLAQS